MCPTNLLISGKFPAIEAEININLSYVAIGEYFIQGEEALDVIQEISDIAEEKDLTDEEAILFYKENYLCL